jgi:hypothetical protein
MGFRKKPKNWCVVRVGLVCEEDQVETTVLIFKIMFHLVQVDYSSTTNN